MIVTTIAQEWNTGHGEVSLGVQVTYPLSLADYVAIGAAVAIIEDLVATLKRNREEASASPSPRQ